jgi:hypothetical protein
MIERILCDVLEESDLTSQKLQRVKKGIEQEVKWLEYLIQTNTIVALNRDKERYEVTSDNPKLNGLHGTMREEIIHKIGRVLEKHFRKDK